jgi:hypothetical protein
VTHLCTCGQQSIEKVFCLGCLQPVCYGPHVQIRHLSWGTAYMHTECMYLVPHAYWRGMKNRYAADSSDWLLIAKRISYGPAPTLMRIIYQLSQLTWRDTDSVLAELKPIMDVERELLGLHVAAMTLAKGHGIVDHIRTVLGPVTIALKETFPASGNTGTMVASSTSTMAQTFIAFMKTMYKPTTAPTLKKKLEEFQRNDEQRKVFIDFCISMSLINVHTVETSEVLQSIYDLAADWSKELEAQTRT